MAKRPVKTSKTMKKEMAQPDHVFQKGNWPSVFTLFKPSLEATLENPFTILGLGFSPLFVLVPFFILAAIISVILQRTIHAHSESVVVLSTIIIIVLYVCMIAFVFMALAGLIYATLQSARKQRVTYAASIQVGWHNLARFVGLILILLVVVTIGLVLLIFPGLYLLQRYYFAPYYLIDHNKDIASALKQSAEDSKQYGGSWGLVGLLLIILATFYIPLLGWLFFLVAVSLFICASAVRYLEIQERAGRTPKPKRGKKVTGHRRTAAA